MINAAKNFNILATSLNILYNYFNSLLTLFSNLRLVKFVDTLEKSFFLYMYRKINRWHNGSNTHVGTKERKKWEDVI